MARRRSSKGSEKTTRARVAFRRHPPGEWVASKARIELSGDRFDVHETDEDGVHWVSLGLPKPNSDGRVRVSFSLRARSRNVIAVWLSGELSEPPLSEAILDLVEGRVAESRPLDETFSISVRPGEAGAFRVDLDQRFSDAPRSPNMMIALRKKLGGPTAYKGEGLAALELSDVIVWGE